jgi:predicted phosphodiesterase
MKVIVFSDVHGNLPALETMLEHAGPADLYLCLGDVVNYGPWGEECVQRVAALPDCIWLEGNHETYFIKNRYDGTHPLPKVFFEQCIRRFRSFDLIKNLPQEYRLGGFRFVHTIEDRNIYPDSEVDLRENLFIGHSHHQFRREINNFTLVNVGSVGQNRKYINVVSYAVFYPETGKIELRNTVYNEQLMLDEMKKLGYPAECIEYYDNKQRQAISRSLVV